ncbi:SufE family protein [Horticoccus luteus]|uniref:SufE family protein n=1 Tax=Horticoccus luteus TaxID=2862869 RepID=A0A8F9TUW3_9BACT|nr:SufE family protein [Horticoccus luteus]QYM79709.1 SufE family protein [Horticoccus luteus]
MTLAEKELQFIERYGVFDDPQERLAAIVDRARRAPSLPATQRTAATRIAGCQSPVWVVAEFTGERCRFHADAESPVVRGLVTLLCELFSGATPADIVDFDVALLDELGLTRHLSPTRRHGLANVVAHIRTFARAHLAAAHAS